MLAYVFSEKGVLAIIPKKGETFKNQSYEKKETKKTNKEKFRPFSFARYRCPRGI